MLADDPLAKALRIFEACVSVHNNLCGKLVSSLEFPIKFDERFKVTYILHLKRYIESFCINIISFASSIMKNIDLFFSRFAVKTICCIAFGSASSCLLKFIAI